MRDENGNVTEHDENEVVVLDKMESVEQTLLLKPLRKAGKIRIGLRGAKSFDCIPP